MTNHNQLEKPTDSVKHKILEGNSHDYTKGELIALETFLSDFDRTASFGELIDDICHDKLEIVTVWEPMEHLSGTDIADQITLLAERIDEK